MSNRFWLLVGILTTIIFVVPACGETVDESVTTTTIPTITSAQTPAPVMTAANEREPAIAVEPQPAMADEVVQIQMVNLEPGQIVTLTAEMRDARDRKWTSWATFMADDTGLVDVTTQAPVTGTYQTDDSMGLFWSMLPDVVGADIPYFAPPDTDYQVVTLKGDVAGEQIGPVYLERLLLPSFVQETRVTENGLVGRFYIPETTEPVPAMLVLGGSDGGIDVSKAVTLAAHGYATLALDYFNGPGLPDYLAEIPLEYFAGAIDWLQAQEMVDGEKIGVVGTSRGGELALLLGATFPEVRVVVSFVGGGVAVSGFGNAEAARKAAWTLAGEPVSHATSLETLARGIIAVEKINGPVLLISGKDDRVWPSFQLSEIAMARLQEHEHPFPFVHLAYADAGHAISTPYWPTTGGVIVHPISGDRFYSGGTPAGNARASADSWPQVLTFLKRTFE